MVGGFRTDMERRGLLPGTIDAYTIKVRAWVADGDPLNATPEQVERFLDMRLGRAGRIDDRTRYAWLSTLHQFYDWLHRCGHVECNPVADIRRPKLRDSLPRPIDTADLEHALTVADPRRHLWCMLGAYAGLRISEIAALTRDDVQDRSAVLRILGKGHKERVVPLAPNILAELRTYGMPTRGPVFRRCRGGPWSARTASGDMADWFRSLGIDATAHMLRHWFATELIEAGVDVRVVAELLGHANLNTTRIYTKVSVRNLHAAIAALPTLDTPPARTG